METVVGSYGHPETLRRLVDSITSHGLAVFAQIDHAAAAREVGMELADEVVVLFGNPRAGTPLMQADARIGIELPLRMLVWDGGRQTIIGYNDPRDLAASYDVASETERLDAMSSLLADLAREAAGASRRAATGGPHTDLGQRAGDTAHRRRAGHRHGARERFLE